LMNCKKCSGELSKSKVPGETIMYCRRPGCHSKKWDSARCKGCGGCVFRRQGGDDSTMYILRCNCGAM